MKTFLNILIALTLIVSPAVAQTTDQRVAALESDVTLIKAALHIATPAAAAATRPTMPVIVTPPVTAKVMSPTAPLTAIAPKTLRAEVELRDATKSIADTIFAAGTTGDAALMIRGDFSTVDRVSITTPLKYGIYVEGAQNVTIQDLTLIGPSALQSNIRTARGTGQTKTPSVVLRRVTVTNPVNPFNLGRANLRGEGVRVIDSCDFRGTIPVGSGPLIHGDGGEECGFSRLYANADVIFDNGTAVAAAVNKAMAAGVKDSAGILAVVRNARPTVGGKPYTVTDDIWKQTLAYRAVELAGWSNDTWHASRCEYGLSLMPGAIVSLDGTNEIVSTGVVIREYATVYPTSLRTLPWDKARPPPRLILNGDKITAPGGWGLSDSEKKLILRGWCMFNGKREDYGN